MRADATLRELYALFRRYDISVIPVVGRDAEGRMRRLLGVATRADLLKAFLSAKTSRALEARFARPVSSIVRNAGALRPSEPVSSAFQRITEAGLPALPVVDEGKLVGIVSICDLLVRHAVPRAAEFA